MKKLFIFVLSLSVISLVQAQVGIGTSSPNSNALLDLTSTSKGLLLPRLTVAQRDAISSPPQGLLIFNSDSGNPEVYGKTYGTEAVNVTTGTNNVSTGGDGAWQEFTPTVSGLVTKITLVQNDPTQFGVGFSYQMTMYSNATTFGSSVTGTVIGTAVGTIPAGAGQSTITYTFSSPVYVTSGQNYIFRIAEYNIPAPAYYGDTYLKSSNVYSGSSWVGGSTNQDLCFTVYMKQSAGTGWINFSF